MNTDDLASHERRMHANDTDIAAAVFGPLVAGARKLDEGLVHRVDQLRAEQPDRMRLSKSDRITMVSILFVALADAIARIA